MVDKEKKNRSWIQRKQKRMAATMKGVLEFDNRQFCMKENCAFLITEEGKTGRGVRKIEVAEAKSQTCSEQGPAEMGVAPPTSDTTPAQDTSR